MRGLGLMDLNDAAAYLGMKPHQLRHLAYTGRISFFQMGKRRRYWFSPAQLMEWQTASKMAVEQAEEDLRKLERIDSMFGSGDCDIADYRDCAECVGCHDSMTDRQQRWARMASKKYGACISLIAHWADDWTCPLCGKDISSGGASLDHDHATGEPRGVICARCNHGLHYVDRPDWLQRALVYVQTTGARSARVSDRPKLTLNGVEWPQDAS